MVTMGRKSHIKDGPQNSAIQYVYDAMNRLTHTCDLPVGGNWETRIVDTADGAPATLVGGKGGLLAFGGRYGGPHVLVARCSKPERKDKRLNQNGTLIPP